MESRSSRVETPACGASLKIIGALVLELTGKEKAFIQAAFEADRLSAGQEDGTAGYLSIQIAGKIYVTLWGLFITTEIRMILESMDLT